MARFTQTHCLLDLGQAGNHWIALHEHFTDTHNNGIKECCIQTQDILQDTQLIL